ncbi:hypothetical protein J6590_014843 [Homalodisca vitripennis]|nr:hypothetical protein J6590_014843 [Homalodisca vitripennis]
MHQQHTDVAPYKNDHLCVAGFSIVEDESGTKRYRCDSCCRFSIVEDESGTKRYRCDSCCRSYTHKRSLTKHKRYDNSPYKNDHLCVAGFSIVEDESGTKRYRCDSCCRSYTHKRSLTKHKRYECGDLRPFSCNVCSYTCKQRAHLKIHVTKRHFRL